MEGDLGPELEFRGDVVESELEEVRADAARSRELAQRVQADFENYRKRVSRDQAEAQARAGQRVIEDLFPAIDNLERAIDHTISGGDLAHLLAGVEMVHKQILVGLAKEGVSVIDPFGQPFDPHLHQAMSQREDPEFPEGTIVEVFQKGYLMGDRVIRPAMVVVSTGGPDARRSGPEE